ncbi:hypothetical protein CDL12_16278 [Handroanthus impetiginosus]|uniref:Uncharacterized protein n=1 Tax=Handroanthus impetiginosus TaxID=429701 RepID=A0A2G9H0Q9_9LAMI|nr:hypothetical protein CDL12_16278 [Handroanthus impetiginosus]
MEDLVICLEPLVIEANRSWADCPRDLLSLILSRLFRGDRCNFKLVCKSWNLICSVPPSLPPAIDSLVFDSPCLMIPQRRSCSWKVFHSLCNDFYDLDFPELVGAKIVYSKHGWLLMYKRKYTLFFFNPFTKEKIEIHPIDVPFELASSICFTSPPTSSDCIVCGIESMNNFVAFRFIKVGDKRWRVRLFDNNEYFCMSNCPMVFLNGVCYCSDYKFKNIITYDFIKDEYDLIQSEEFKDGEEAKDNKPPTPRGIGVDLNESRPPTTFKSYMVEVDGDIWAVFITRNNRRVRVQKMDMSKGHWIELKSLEDKCLYIGTGGSFAETCSVGGMTNKIYFDKFHGNSGVMYSLTTGMYYSVGESFVSKEAYELSEVDYGVWVKPTLQTV